MQENYLNKSVQITNTCRGYMMVYFDDRSECCSLGSSFPYYYVLLGTVDYAATTCMFLRCTRVFDLARRCVSDFNFSFSAKFCGTCITSQQYDYITFGRLAKFKNENFA